MSQSHEEKLQYMRKWRQQNKEKQKLWFKNNYEKNKKYILERGKLYRLKNKEIVLLKQLLYRKNNRIKLKCFDKKMKEKYPWIRSYYGARNRCNSPKNHAYKWYGKRGIRFLLTKEEYNYIWFRDNASKMKKPSIDRIDNDDNYCLENCRFIELEENVSKMRKANNYSNEPLIEVSE